MSRKGTQTILLTIDGCEVPLRIYREWRYSVRASIGKSAINLRLPMLFSKRQREAQVEQVKVWAGRQFRSNQSLRKRFDLRVYRDGEELTVGSRSYRLTVAYTDLKSHKGTIRGREIHLRLVRGEGSRQLAESSKRLVSRLVAADFREEIEQRVHFLNDRYFRQPLNDIRLKYNQTNWGSCSAKGNINLSTRLLFAPPDVIDYVIIHELAHRVELNHSERFWELVAQAMPDFREKEAWLKANGHLCHF